MDRGLITINLELLRVEEWPPAFEKATTKTKIMTDMLQARKLLAEEAITV